jgi:hypothetical protein
MQIRQWVGIGLAAVAISGVTYIGVRLPDRSRDHYPPAIPPVAVENVEELAPASAQDAPPVLTPDKPILAPQSKAKKPATKPVTKPTVAPQPRPEVVPAPRPFIYRECDETGWCWTYFPWEGR